MQLLSPSCSSSCRVAHLSPSCTVNPWIARAFLSCNPNPELQPRSVSCRKRDFCCVPPRRCPLAAYGLWYFGGKRGVWREAEGVHGFTSAQDETCCASCCNSCVGCGSCGSCRCETRGQGLGLEDRRRRRPASEAEGPTTAFEARAASEDEQG